MVGLMAMGKALIGFAFALVAVVAAAGFVTGGALAVALAPAISLLMLAGVVLAYLLPILPFLFFLLAATGYFLVVIEAVVAVNLWAIGHMRMDGEGFSGPGGRQGWLLLLTLTLTPVLMILGYIAGMIVFRVSATLLSTGFFYAVEGIIGGDFTFGLIAVVGYSVLMAVFFVVLLERSFSLISEFPSRVLRWIGEGDLVVSQSYAVAPGRPRATGGRGPTGLGGNGTAAPGSRGAHQLGGPVLKKKE
jgi:conjugal transfer/type IV secretion protein DotA/TraY